MIRALEERDLPEVAAIEAASFSDPWPETVLRDLLILPNRALVWDEGGIAGYIGVRQAAGTGEVTVIAVRGADRRRGIAEKLMEAAFGLLRQDGASEVFLEVRRSNRAAIALYEKTGFLAVGTRKDYYVSPAEDALIYRKELV